MSAPSGTIPPSPSPTAPSTSASSARGTIALSSAELLWLTIAIWIGGIFILTLMPVLLIPRLGLSMGVVASYFVFFLTWQPIQIITQRTLGLRTGVIRMVIFVGAAATIAFYLREALLAIVRAG